jgi:hypothetical protein
MNTVEQMKIIQNEAFELFTKKNMDYGVAFAKYGLIGVLMRIENKVERSMPRTKKLINAEEMRETFINMPQWH